MEKKTLSPEQLAKMQEGRRKAYEARKKAREEEKEAKKQAKLLAKKTEEEAIKQQREQRELVRKANEAKAKKKGDLSALKVKNKKKVNIATDDEVEYYEPDVLSPVPEEEEQAEQPEEIQAEQPEEKPEPEETEEEKYKRVFESESLKVLNKLPNNAKDLFKKAKSKFDCNLSVDDNIKSMIDYCKELVKANVKTAEVIKAHVEEKKDIKPPVEQVQKEREIEQKIYAIMKRFK